VNYHTCSRDTLIRKNFYFPEQPEEYLYFTSEEYLYSTYVDPETGDVISMADFQQRR
jgi:hypothetical protein